MKTQILHIEATSQNTSAVLEFVENTLLNEHIPLKLVQKLLICTDEIYANITQYANATFVKIQCSVSENQVILEFKDDGIPYNPLNAPPPDTSLSPEERPLGGYGIHIVKKLADHVQYQSIDNQNVLSITFRI